VGNQGLNPSKLCTAEVKRGPESSPAPAAHRPSMAPQLYSRFGVEADEPLFKSVSGSPI
jgi:hypothetical protein